MWKIFKICFLFFLVLILVFVIIEIRQDSPKSILKNLLTKGNLEGDRLIFKAKFLGVITAGIATMENKGIEDFQGKSVYHLVGGGQSAKWLSAFFKAEASCDSYVDKDKLHSLEFRQHLAVSEHPTEDKIIKYDQDNLIMDTGEQRRQILPDTRDPISLMFYLQRQTFSVGKDFDLNINTNQKNYQFKAKVIDKKQFLVDGENIGVWMVKADVGRRDKSRRNSSSVTMWLVDNEVKTPLLFKVMTPIGPITIRLTELH